MPAVVTELERPAPKPRSRPSRLIPVALGFAVVVVLSLAAVRFGGRIRTERAAFPATSGQLALSGLAGRVDLLRDRRGVPHIEARSEADAWFAMGFVHAQDRLAQMLWLRRTARGEMSEVIGKDGLAADRLARTLGIARLAEAQVERLDEPVRRLLNAYARGVNARLARVVAGRVAPPLGAAPIDHAPAPWTSGDSLALLKLVHWCSGPLPESSLLLEALVARLGGTGARPFFPTGLGVQGIGLPFDLPGGAVERSRLVAAGPGASQRLSEVGLLGNGFSASGFVLSGRVTASRAPILVVDMHLLPTMPPLFYELRVRGGELDAAGATIPGIPMLWAGRNADVAWAATPVQVLTVSLHREELDGDRYRDDDEWQPLVVREEVIQVADGGGAARGEIIRIRSTRHGPLLETGSDPAEGLAIAWTGARVGDGLASFASLARARRADAVIDSLREHHEPVLAVLYADREGTIGSQLAGWIPRLALPTGMVPVPARMSIFDWRRRIGFSALPARRIEATREADAPTSNDWLIAADNALAESFGSGFGTAGIEWSWRTGERAARLEDLLRRTTETPGVDLRRIVDEQAHLVDAVSTDLVASMLALGGDPLELSAEGREVADLLVRWDGRMDARSTGAAAYQVVVDHLIFELFAAPMGEALLRRYLSIPGTRMRTVVEQVIEDAAESPAAGGWADSERVGEAVRTSLADAWRTLRDRLGPNRKWWQLGGLQEVAFRQFAPTPLLGGLPRPPMRLQEGEAVAGLADFAPTHPYRARRISSYRMAVDLGAPDRMLSAFAPGQSEHPGHPHFDDGLAPWLAGRSSLFATSRFLVEEEDPDRLVLVPAS